MAGGYPATDGLKIMCGIIAYLGVDEGIKPEQIERQADLLRHRGPDGAGLQQQGQSIVAHRRLAIIDVAGGQQPLQNEDGTLTLICNGEIYNHQQLRQRLQRPHQFLTQSDSEVILHLFEEQGAECVSQLDGMFAFVLTDGVQVLAARDPLGIKPLYLGHDANGGLWFASELKALVGVCAAIEEFPPGFLYTNGEWRQWYQPTWENRAGRDSASAREMIAAKLEAAVGKRLMSDVPVGVFLSGGLDSSLIAALMRRNLDKLHSFSVGLAGSPDLEAARTVAAWLGTQHHEYIYSPEEAVSVLETVIAHLESWDPALIRSAIPCYFVSRLASDYVKVVLSGEGADEAFAGYLYFAQTDEAGLLQRESVRLLRGLHNMNLQRVDRMTMAHSLEGRVPFLDPGFLDTAMAIDPAEKLHQPGRAEKWLLRQAFTGLLPEEILWRTKQEFAQGCGSEWTLRDYCAEVVSDKEFARASSRFHIDVPLTREAFHYRRIFAEFFPGAAAARTVGRWHGAFAPHGKEF